MPFNYNFQNDDDLISQKWNNAKIGNSKISSQNANSNLPQKNEKTQNETWTILTPPPNLTGNLHAGHALEHFIMDSLSRQERQNGKQVLYYPGIDHAGIQLEGVINKLIGKGEFDEEIKKNFETDFDDLNKETSEFELSSSLEVTLNSQDFAQNLSKTTSKIKIQIRKAQNSDTKNVLEINKNSWLKTYPNEELAITKEGILAIDWEKNLEKAKNNPEYGKNLWLLEIDLGIEIDDEKLESFVSNQTKNVENSSAQIVKNEKKVIGFVRFLVNENNRSQVKAIYLDPHFVGRGFGTDLMIFAIEKLGFDRDFEVQAANYNQNAIQFYQKFGFEKTEEKLLDFPIGDKLIPQIQLIAKREIIKTKIDQIRKEIDGKGAKKSIQKANTNDQNNSKHKIDKFQEFQSQKSEDRANWLKKNYPEIWLKLAWSKVNLWRDNQKNQSLILGDSPDWDKQLFTLDARAVAMVDLAFENYWRDGLIYRDSYLINWSVALQTALSDVPEDIGRSEQIDPLVTFEYEVEKIENIKISSDKELAVVEKIEKNIDRIRFLVATVRIETVFADIAIAIHPTKFAQVFDFLENSEAQIAKELILTKKIKILLGIKPVKVQNIELIIDESVDLEFGTGMLKITPAHDLADYNIAKKHNFTNFTQAIGRSGKLTEICGEFAGLSVQAGRNLVMKRLLETGFIPKK